MGKYNRIATRECKLEDLPFVRPSQDHDAGKRSTYRGCSQNILNAALRHFERVAHSSDEIEEQIRQFDLLDVRLRWLLHCAMKVVYGTEGDPRPRYITAEGTQTANAVPQKVTARARTLEGLTEAEVNRQFGEARPGIAQAIASQVDAEIPMGTLRDYWTDQLAGTMLTAEDLPLFPEGEEYLADLWRSAVPDPKEIQISKKELSNALRPLDGRKSPGYDGLTYFAYKVAHRGALFKYWTKLFNWLFQRRVMLPSWKIGLQVFLPKPNKADYSLPKSWRPITLYPTVFKIACRVISLRASKQMVRANQMSWAQKGGVSGVSGTTDATFLLRSCIDHHRRHKTTLYVLFMDVANAFGSLELGLIEKIINLTSTDAGIKGWWIDSTRGCSIHIKSGRNLSPRIPVSRGVAQGNTNSALTFNTVKNTVNLWVNHECVGYPLYGTSVPDLSYVDDEALLSGDFNDLQAMIRIHEKWSNYASLKYDAKKCALLCEEYGMRQIRSPPRKVLLCGQEIQQLFQGETYRHLGLDQNFGRMAGSGNRRCGEKPQFFANLIKRVQDMASKVVDLTTLHCRNRIELLDQNVKSIAEFAIQAVEVPKTVLADIDAIIYRAVRKILGIGPQQGPVCMLQSPTRLRGLRIKSMVDIYWETLICNSYRWLHNCDNRLRSLLIGRVTDARSDCGLMQDAAGEVFFDIKFREIPRPRRDEQEDEMVQMKVVKSVLNPRLQFERGRTLVPLIYRACSRYKVRIDSQGEMWIPLRGRWIQVEDVVMLKSHLRRTYLQYKCSELRDIIASKQWSCEFPISSKSYRWLRKDLTRDPQYQVACQMLLNVLPCNSLKEVWTRRTEDPMDPRCTLCVKRSRETVKHIVCSCSTPQMANLRNARHNKVVRELCIWLEIAGARGRLVGLQFRTHLSDLVGLPSTAISVGAYPDICFSFERDGVREYHIWEVTVTMDNAMGTALEQKRLKYTQVISELARSAKVPIHYRVLVFGVMGAIPANFEKVLRRITIRSQTDWLVDEIHKTLLYYNHALWCARDQLVRARARGLTH